MIRRHFLILSGIAAVMIATRSNAADLTISLTGSFHAATCDWSSGDANTVVTLEDISQDALPRGKVVALKSFKLDLDKCSAGTTGAKFTFTGTPAAGDPLRFLNTGGAQGVAVQLQSADGKVIGADGTDNQRTVAIVNGRASLPLAAGYWRLATQNVVPGSVSAIATVTVEYM
ncbi:fimbrial protein [Pinirhizobacter sp.]|jgi:type 1 fimbria pilin|uniref:fimbrial protein n=1 Tax=Pinirhizobacter sp. TaxID=2950432 RepID=UPI002F40CB20